MALAGGVPAANCMKNNTFMLYVKGESYGDVKIKRGDPTGTGKFVCEDAPRKEDQAVSSFWNKPFIKLKIRVEKKAKEVKDLRDGIFIECQEFDCPFNKGKER